MFKRLSVLFLLAIVLLFLLQMNQKATKAPDSVEEPSPVVPLTAYEHGRMTGHHAFLNQTGQYIPMPKIASYSSKIEDDEEEFSKGYVDGYHRAAEMMHCPRN